MRQPEDVRQQFTRQWIDKAERDYAAGSHLLPAGGVYFEAVAFHAQQAAEKYLKALLVWHQIEFPKTHDINLLLTLLSDLQSGLPTELAEAGNLTSYAVEYRYPGDYPEVTRKDAQEALEIAAKVRQAVLQALSKEVVP